MRSRLSGPAAGATIALALASAAAESGAQAPCPAPVPGWQAPEPGEHPRLFFRRSDLSEIRRRAETPEGRRIVERLRLLLNGGDGETLPAVFSPSRKATNSSATPPADPHAGVRQPAPRVSTDEEEEGEDVLPDGADGAGSGVYTNYGGLPPGRVYTLWHAAGYGMLWQLSGRRAYAELGRQCVEKALDGQRDRDNRYSFVDPHGALRAGPSLGAIAMGYDLCADAWDDSFRRRVAESLARYDQGPYENLDDLARGARHFPGKNHWGGQVGGAALALLAIRGDPGASAPARIERLLATNAVAMLRHLLEGFGDGGLYAELQGPGGIASDTAYVPALQAWRVAGGKDFVSPRREASCITVLKAHELVLIAGRPWYTLRNPGNYGSGNFSPFAVGGCQSDRIGLSRGGQFAQGFGAVEERYRPALLWVYNEIVEREAAARTFDTVSAYPHRAVLSLVNWPISLTPQNPETVLPRLHEDRRRGYLVARNRWKDAGDIVVTLKTPIGDQPAPIMVWGCDVKLSFARSPGPTRTFFHAADDGSFILSNPKGMTWLAVDFSRASGADLLLAMIGKYAEPGTDARSAQGTTAKFHAVEACGYSRIVLLTVQSGEPPAPRVEGDAIVVGGQTVRFDGRRFSLGVMASGPPPSVMDSDYVYTPRIERETTEGNARRVREAEEQRVATIRKIENRLKEAERLAVGGEPDAARAIAADILKTFPEGPYAIRASAVLRKASDALLNLE
jgi:hypothetical protein